MKVDATCSDFTDTDPEDHRPKYCGAFVRVITSASRSAVIGVSVFPRWVVAMNRSALPSVLGDEAVTGISLKSGSLVLITTLCAIGDVVHAASRVSFPLRKSKT